MGKALVIAVMLCALRANAGTEQLSLSSQIQYSRVIQGATEPITALVYNNASSGSDTGNYRVTAAYAPSGDTSYTSIGYSYTGSVPANSGTVPASMSFPIDTSTFTPGTVAVTVSGSDTDTGGVLTQGGQFTVLAHANPAFVVNGQIVYLTSKNVVKFQTPTNNNVFGQAPPGGTDAPGSFNPQMLGDPPGEPTAELDLDSITTNGSAYLTTTLHTFSDLPANDNPAEALPFEIDAFVPGVGDYITTFTLHYSDEDDLPGAAAPGSEALSFTVEANVSDSVTDWTLTTVPEPTTFALSGARCRRSIDGKAAEIFKLNPRYLRTPFGRNKLSAPRHTSPARLRPSGHSLPLFVRSVGSAFSFV